MNGNDPLVQTLTKLLIELTRFIDSTIDEDGEPRAAAKQLDFVAGTFDQLTPDQRGSLAEIVQQRRQPSRPQSGESSWTPSPRTSASLTTQSDLVNSAPGTQVTRSQTPTNLRGW